ncbi:MAG: cytochrome P450 [Minicystis sp.]
MPNLAETLQKTAALTSSATRALAKLPTYSSLLRRARVAWHTRSGGAAPPPSAFPGWQSVPVLGLLPRLKAISTDPVGLMVRSHEAYGDIFTIYIPFNSFDLTYLMGQDGYQFVLGLPAEEGRMGKVMLNVPAMGFWFPRSDESEEHMQALVVAARPLMADLLRRRERPHDEIARSAVARHLPRWGAEVDIGEAVALLVHDAAATVMFGEKLWARLRPVAGPAIRAIADSVDVARVALAKTPYGRFMPEYRATLELHAAFASAIEEHGRTGAYPVLDRIAAQRLGDEPLPAADVPWMMLSILWNATVYTGAYATWAFCDLLAHPDLQRDLAAADAARRARLLASCLTETIRQSPVASLPRYVKEPMDIDYRGKRYHIGAGTYLAASPLSLANDPAVYREPARYDPHRYDRGEPAPSLFGRGAFGCVAQGFVYTLVTTLFNELLGEARFELSGPLPERVVRIHLTYPSDPIRARLHRREAPRPALDDPRADPIQHREGAGRCPFSRLAAR